MKLLFVAIISLLLAGCQSPLVSVHDMSYQVRFDVSGQHYSSKVDYRCHYEGLTWVSERGQSWHVRSGANSVRVIGVLTDGSKYQVLPGFRNGMYGGRCDAGSEPIESTVFIESGVDSLESFDKARTTSATRTVNITGSRLVLTSTGSDSFKEQKEWPTTRAAPTRYFSIWVTTYERSAWRNKPEVDELINSKKIVWLETGKRYPFMGWSADDVTYARIRAYDANLGGYSVLPRPSHAQSMVIEGDEWSISKSENRAVQWLKVDTASDATAKERAGSASALKRWVIYDASRIEVPILNYYRIFYEPKHDRLIEFKAQHVYLVWD